MGDQQPCVTVDEEDMLDLVDESMLEYDLCEGGSGPPGFPAPSEAAPSEAVLQRFIERLEGFIDGLTDRLADRRDNERIEDVYERPRMATDRALRSLL